MTISKIINGIISTATRMIPQIMHKLSYYPWICSCIDTQFTISNDIKSESICMNEVPPKIWRLNQEKNAEHQIIAMTLRMTYFITMCELNNYSKRTYFGKIGTDFI